MRYLTTSIKVIFIATLFYVPYTTHAALVDVGCGAQIEATYNAMDCSPLYVDCDPTEMGQQEEPQRLKECPVRSGDFYLVRTGGQCVPDVRCTTPDPTATLTANPSGSVLRGTSILLTWGSTNAVSCTGTNFSTGGATSGSNSVVQTDNSTTYSVTCTNSASENATQSLTITAFDPPFAASCSPNKVTALIGESVTWSASAANGQSPYTFKWGGELLDGLLGTPRTVTYTTAGRKSADITVTDSATAGSGFQPTFVDATRCTGAQIGGDFSGGHVEDIGTLAQNIRALKNLDMLGLNEGEAWNPPVPADYIANPQNYCVEGNLKEYCNPNLFVFGSGACPFYYKTTIHVGTGTRVPENSEYGPFFRSCGEFGCSGWSTNQYYGTLVGRNEPGVPNTTTNLCSAEVVVAAAAAATATLSANPVSIIAGQSSTLTWSSTNATACTSPDFATGNATSGSVVVSPVADTTYTVTCTGSGAPATSSATVTVTPLLAASCSVSPTTANIGDTVTWTAAPTGGSGLYNYSWSGTDGLTGSTQSITHSYGSAGPNTGSVTVTSGSQSVTQACSNSVTVNAPPPPPPVDADLTAGDITPTSAVALVPTTLSATATNISTSTASGAFPILFQIQETGVLLNSAYLASLAPTASAPGTVSYTFPSAGTYHVRACANFNTSWVAITPESNYANNCAGAWTTVTVTGGPGGTVSCTVSNTTPDVGDTITYTATPAGGASGPYTWDDSVGGSYGSSATASRLLSIAGNYAMQVTATGASAPGNCPLVTAGVSACSAPTTGGLAAEPSRVKKGGTSKIHVSLERSTGVSCTLSGPGVLRNYPVITSCTGPIPIFEEEIITPSITGQSVYTLTCDGTQIAQTIVNVIPAFIEF